MKYLVGNAPPSGFYTITVFSQFLEWVRMQKILQLDIETTVTEYWCDKKLITLQFGSNDGQTQWVLQWSSLSNEEKSAVKRILEDPWHLKIGHNILFEIVVCLFHDMRVQHVYDTMLMEMILYCGEILNEDNPEEEANSTFYALSSLHYRYLGAYLDKTEQTNFGDDILTEAKVLYAAKDVEPLGAIRRMQMLELHVRDLEYVAALENEVVEAYAEITYNGLEIDQEKWLANEDLAAPVVAKAKQDLDEWLTKEPFFSKAVELKFISEKDKMTINWNSPVQSRQVLSYFFPFLGDKMTKAAVTKLLKDHKSTGTVFSDDRAVPFVEAIRDKNWAWLEPKLVEIDKQWLIENNFLLPAMTPVINWNSRDQVLPILQTVHKGLPDLSKPTMEKFTHPIGEYLREYKDSLKLLTTYGAAFLEKYVEPDGKVRTTFTQIVSTGRVSSKRPNMQNIPAKEAVGTRYRNAFVCEPDWEFIDSDFASQELVIIAYISGDPVWNAALKHGEDLHSVCAELVFPDKAWEKVAEPDCAYYKKTDSGTFAKQKCKCKGHKRMRSAVKSINFGLAYGMSEFKLSSSLGISLQEAKKLIQDYFKAFPGIGSALASLGYFGVTRGYIQTIAPFFRKRWFPYWRYARGRINDHITKVQYDPTLGSIERASKNQPIQGTAADITKTSLLMLYWRRHEPMWETTAKLVMQVHDQNTTICHKSVSAEWFKVVDDTMKEAAKFIIPNGLLGCETTISPVWTK